MFVLDKYMGPNTSIYSTICTCYHYLPVTAIPLLQLVIIHDHPYEIMTIHDGHIEAMVIHHY